MRATEPERIRETVYVIGAGFSAGLGYPLTKSLLIDVWGRLNPSSRKQLRRIIEFHHPAFDSKRKTTFPDIEQLLTEIAVNLDLFDASRPTEGNFSKQDLLDAREELLSEIAQWFHEIYEDANQAAWLSTITTRFRAERAAIISFNWDLILDHTVFSDTVLPQSYGLGRELGSGPVLLKPHGSLNWYESSQIQKVAAEKRITIFEGATSDGCIEAFLRPRGITSKVGRKYTPLIVPPTFLKDFKRPIFQTLWKRCTDVLSTAKEIIFLGYSLPTADLQAQFIFRCGFHNQLEGRLRNDGRRYEATGPAKVTIVNPDQDAARRIEFVAGPRIACRWSPKRVQQCIEC